MARPNAVGNDPLSVMELLNSIIFAIEFGAGAISTFFQVMNLFKFMGILPASVTSPLNYVTKSYLYGTHGILTCLDNECSMKTTICEPGDGNCTDCQCFGAVCYNCVPTS
jgi:hypothetical protein